MPDRNYYKQILQTALIKLSPQPRWAAIITHDGLLLTTYQLPFDEDRASAMSGASLALGERISSELQNGDLREVIFLGTTGIYMQVVIDDEWVLSANFADLPSWDAMRSQFHKAIQEMKPHLDRA